VKEKDLKHLFISSLGSGHTDYNDFLPTSATSSREIRVRDEGYFRNFDLVIAILEKHNESDIRYDSIRFFDNYFNILTRTGLLAQFAKAEKCRIDWIRFYPVELKSDDDALDERLPNQILNAILTFGRSLLVLDEKHSKKAKLRSLLKLIPATVIGYTGTEDHFQTLSVFDRFVTDAMFHIPKRTIVRILRQNGVSYDNVNKIYRCLANLQRINQKIAFSQLYEEDNQDLGFKLEEMELLQRLIDISTKSSDKKEISKWIRFTADTKITDYF
jgi:hypothetical protein